MVELVAQRRKWKQRWMRRAQQVGMALGLLGVGLGTVPSPMKSGRADPVQPKVEARRDPAYWPFSTDSPWNTPIGSGATVETARDRCTRSVRDPSIPAWIVAAEWGHPIYVAKETDPIRKIHLRGRIVATIHIPTRATPALPRTPDSDAHLHIVTPDHRAADEMWRAVRRPDGGFDVEGHTRTDLLGPGVFWGGQRAYGGSALGGLIRRGELRNGIHHALTFTLPRRLQRSGPVWPASEQDDGGERDYGGHVPIGQLVILPRSVDPNALGLSPQGRAIAVALRDYGAYNVDSATDFSLSAEPAVEEELGTAREDLAKLRALLVCVTNNRKENVGGGGVRSQAAAPPFLPEFVMRPIREAARPKVDVSTVNRTANARSSTH
ncbi:MAG TPA: hypothetical protein PKE31_02065 [Pseudomonadota bacterium]|nr:hypothetical protein [Pseudomonadota bacterium]HMU37777.1 hypothetical protein [Pseudomonadota bacterium]